MKTAQCVTFQKTDASETINIVVLFQRSPIRDRQMTFSPFCISVFFVIFRACIAISVCFILSAVAITSRAVYALVADNKLGRVGKLPRQVLKRFFFFSLFWTSRLQIPFVITLLELFSSSFAHCSIITCHFLSHSWALSMMTTAARKTSLGNKHLRKCDYFRIIPSCSPSTMLTKYAKTELVYTPLN